MTDSTLSLNYLAIKNRILSNEWMAAGQIFGRDLDMLENYLLGANFHDLTKISKDIFTTVHGAQGLDSVAQDRLFEAISLAVDLAALVKNGSPIRPLSQITKLHSWGDYCDAILLEIIENTDLAQTPQIQSKILGLIARSRQAGGGFLSSEVENFIVKLEEKSVPGYNEVVFGLMLLTLPSFTLANLTEIGKEDLRILLQAANPFACIKDRGMRLEKLLRYLEFTDPEDRRRPFFKRFAQNLKYSLARVTSGSGRATAITILVVLFLIANLVLLVTGRVDVNQFLIN